MEKPYTGLTARILLNDVLLGYINNVTLDLSKDIAEVLQFGAQYREKLPTIKNWTASSEGTAAFTSGGSQEKLYQAFESGEEVTLQIKLDEAVYFQGTALVSSLSISASPDSATTISAEFEGSGSVTFTLPETVIATLTSGVGGTINPAGVIRAVKGAALAVTCLPSQGKVANKYYLNGATTGTAITSNAFSVTLTDDTHIFVDFVDAD